MGWKLCSSYICIFWPSYQCRRCRIFVQAKIFVEKYSLKKKSIWNLLTKLPMPQVGNIVWSKYSTSPCSLANTQMKQSSKLIHLIDIFPHPYPMFGLKVFLITFFTLFLMVGLATQFFQIDLIISAIHDNFWQKLNKYLKVQFTQLVVT